MGSFVSGWTANNRTYLVERISEDEVKLRTVKARYSFFMTGLDNDDRWALARDSRVEGAVEQGEYTRIDCGSQWARQGLLKALRAKVPDERILEADVSPLRRLLSDVPSLEIDSEPRLLYLDIETDSRKSFDEATSGEARVLTWAVCGADGSNPQSYCLEEDSDEAEVRLFEAFFEAARNYDCILAWYGSGFDFPVIQKRAEKLGVKHRGRAILWHRWTWLDHLEAFKRHNGLASGEEKTSFALDHVAQYLLGEGKGKLAFDSSKTWEAWVAGGESRELLLRYNEQDTALLPRIEEKTGYLALHMVICQVCRVFPDTESLQATTQGDGFLLRLGDEHGYRWKTKKHFEGTPEKFKGAYVMEPRKLGAVENVHVADFSGFYPSVMRTFNMSPDTKVSNRGSREGICQLPNRETYFRTDHKGMFTLALDQLVAKRAEYAALMKKEVPGSKPHEKFKRLSQAVKVVANSFYGIIGSPFSRFFDVEIAEGVTQTCRFLLEVVIEESEKVGLFPFYGDTDSVFVSGDAEMLKTVIAQLNESWPKRLEPWGVKGKDYIDLDFEKTFSRIIMITAKRYAGKFLMYKGKAAPDDAPPEIKGLEFNRGDSIRLAREFQKQVVMRLLEPELPSVASMKELVSDWKSRVYRGVLTFDDIVISQSLSKPLDEYKDSPPPHVRVAHELLKRGEEVKEGTRIRYVVIPSVGGDKKMNPIPADDLGAIEQIDRIYYWDKRVRPPVERILEKVFPETAWKETAKEKRAHELERAGQETLFDTVGAITTTGPRMKRRRKKKLSGLVIELVEHSPIEEGGAEEENRRRFMKALKAAIAANPGDLSVTVSVMFESYIEKGRETKVEISVPEGIANNQKARAALKRIISEPNSFKFVP